jgi:two-component system, chemotaxis family, response regulator Rcp1
MNGFDVLTEVKSNPSIQKIPVIIFSSSTSDNDVLRSYDLKANSYVSKPTDFNEFLNVVRTIDEFWFQTVKLPSC